MNWEKKSIPFEIKLDLNKTVVDRLRQELRGTARFSYVGPMEAANWCVMHNTNLEEALEWASLAANMNPDFNTLLVKAEALSALGKTEEAERVLDEALPKGSVFQLHSYGRQLISNGKVDEALNIFQKNAKLHKNEWPVNYGLAQDYSAKGEYAKAISHLKKAEKNCPDDMNREVIKKNLDRLSKGEDIN